MSKTQYILSHDVGTSSVKTALVDLEGRIEVYDTEYYATFYPHVNWAEQDPDQYWDAIVKTTRRAMEGAKVQAQDVVGMVFTTQVLGIIPMDKDDRVLRRAIIWMDGRASKQAAKIMSKFGGPKVFATVAGAALSGKDGLAKLLWLKENEPDTYHQMDRFLDVNGYLTFCATGKKVFEWSCASAIGFDLKKKDWLRMVINYIGLDLKKFPDLVRSIEGVGGLTNRAAQALGLLPGTPVFGGSGDMQSAAIGSGAVGEGEGHIYLGTSGWVGVTTSKTPTGSCGVVTLQSGDPKMNLVIGEMETAGACLEWIRKEFYRHEEKDPMVSDIYALLDELIRDLVPGSDYLICTPWLYGERCPRSDTFVRSTFFNLSASHKREHMLRAVYEGVGYNLRWIIEILESKYGFSMPVLRVIGGGSQGDAWMQIIADITQRRVETVSKPQMVGAVGAACIAAVGLRIHPDFSRAVRRIGVDKSFLPRVQNAEVYNVLYGSYKALYFCLRKLYRQVNLPRVKAIDVDIPLTMEEGPAIPGQTFKKMEV